MKIDGVDKTRLNKVDKTKKKSSSSSASFADHLSDSSESQATSPSSAMSGIAGVMALQAAEHSSEEESRGKALQQGQDMVETLEDLRRSLLLGEISSSQLQTIAQNLEQSRPNFTDPALNDMLDEIELRVAVELAKYQR